MRENRSLVQLARRGKKLALVAQYQNRGVRTRESRDTLCGSVSMYTYEKGSETRNTGKTL
jgi:hypothetical protein